MLGRSQYRLLDFGEGRKLEQFGPYELDRPCPAAGRLRKSRPELWQNADARYERRRADRGKWAFHRSPPNPWNLTHESIVVGLKPTESGHVGLFPEQADNWDWIGVQVRSAVGEPPGVLNLFAYTGASTLAAAAAGAQVTHVDAAQNSVNWARENAALSGLVEAPIRWIAEDALKFVRRELKRGNRYHAVILDPPSYGHGPRGEAWKLTLHLPELLERCVELTSTRCRFMLLSCHAPQIGPGDLKQLLVDALGRDATGDIDARDLFLDADGRRLNCGAVARYAHAGS